MPFCCCCGSGGILFDLLKAILVLPWQLVIAARRRSALEDVAQRCREAGAQEVHIVVVDFALEEDCSRLIAEVCIIFQCLRNAGSSLEAYGFNLNG
jgi:short-subunit dehydrogenase